VSASSTGRCRRRRWQSAGSVGRVRAAGRTLAAARRHSRPLVPNSTLPFLSTRGILFVELAVSRMLRSTPLLGTRRRSATAAILGGRLLATAAPPSASSSSARPAPLKLAIIGAGPSGLYAASRILAQLPAEDDRSQVHVYERLPAPHGLVRYGVAPDHPEVKVRIRPQTEIQASPLTTQTPFARIFQNVQHKFDLLANDPRFSFFGNVAVGPSSPPELAAAASSPAAYPYPAAVRLPLESLLPHYSHVLLSYGSSLSAPLPHTPGASSSAKPLANVYPALAFVSWYNGHPAFADLAVDLSTVKHVTVVGQGNVALDCARLLVKDVDALATSDLPEHVLDVLRRSAVETVEVVGRRGPAQVAFTTKEFREMLALEDVRFEGPGEAELAEALAEVARVGGSEERMRKRLLGLMAKGSSSSSTTTSKPSKTFKLSFLRSPKAFLPTSDDAVAGAEGRPPPPAVKSIRWALNGLLPTPTHAPTVAASATAGDPPNTPAPSNPVSTAVPTGVELETATDMVIESVGYRSEPLVLQATAAAAKGDERPEQEAAVWPEGWFDDRRGRVRNVGGRVVSADGEIVRPPQPSPPGLASRAS